MAPPSLALSLLQIHCLLSCYHPELDPLSFGQLISIRFRKEEESRDATLMTNPNRWANQNWCFDALEHLNGVLDRTFDFGWVVVVDEDVAWI